ncbi:hypothetical protein ACWOQL_29515 [Pseudomonas aeruginosa]
MNNQAPSLERRIEEVQHYYGDTLGWSEVAMYFPGIPPSATFKLAK